MDARIPNPPKVAVVSRGETPSAIETRLAAVFAALRAEGLEPRPCIYDEAAEPAVRAQLSGCDAALVWVNPVQDGRRRVGLDAILREAAAAGVQVSGHPDVIARMGTKAVLWLTRDLGWSGDARRYESPSSLADEFPARLAGGARVLKPNRGNGGIGVWKVEAVGAGMVRVQSAEGDGEVETVSLAAFLADRLMEFEAVDGFVDQAFQPRLPDGMIRCYMSGDRVAGFGRQKVRALMPPGTPAEPRRYSGPEDPRFQRLGALMAGTWTPELCRLLDIDPADLPAIWDADFFFGPRTDAGEDTFVLCEINASSVFPMPEQAPAAIARTLRARLATQAAREV